MQSRFGFRRQTITADAEEDALLQQQIRDVLRLDNSAASDRQAEELRRTLMQQAMAGVHDETPQSSALQPYGQAPRRTSQTQQRSQMQVPYTAAATGMELIEPPAIDSMQRTLQLAYERNNISQHPDSRSAMLAPSSSVASYSPGIRGAGLLLASGHIHGSGDSGHANLSHDLEARAGVQVLSSQLDALHESLRRFTFARIEQQAEFRAALPHHTHTHQSQRRTEQIEPEKHRRMQQQPLQPRMQLPRAEYSSSVSPYDSRLRRGASATASAASISVIHSPEATLARSLQLQGVGAGKDSGHSSRDNSVLIRTFNDTGVAVPTSLQKIGGSVATPGSRVEDSLNLDALGLQRGS